MSRDDVDDSEQSHERAIGRRTYLMTAGATLAAGVAGCTDGGGDGGGDDGDSGGTSDGGGDDGDSGGTSDGGGDDGDSGGTSDGGSDDGSDSGGENDPFTNVEVGPLTVTAEVADDADVDEIALQNGDGGVATDRTGDEIDPVELEGGVVTAEFPVWGRPDDSEHFFVNLQDGEYVLAARRTSGDGETTVVGERSVTVERAATVTDARGVSEGDVEATVENSGNVLIPTEPRMRLVEEDSPFDPDAAGEWDFGRFEEAPNSSLGYDRTDEPSHEYELEDVLLPGEAGTYRGDTPGLESNDDQSISEEEACTGQSTTIEIGALGTKTTTSPTYLEMTVYDSVRGTLTLGGGVANSNTGLSGTSYACGEASIDLEE